VIVGLGSTRNLSFWRSTPAPSSVPAPSPVPPEEVLDDLLEPEVIAGTTPVPEPTSIPEFVSPLDLSSMPEVLPLNYGDLAALGFSHWTPVGIAQWTMELIQVSSGMSWFWTIVTVSILSRFVILPFSLNAIRSSARLAPYQPRLLKLRNELQNTGGLSMDPLAVQRISLQQKQVYEEAGVSVLGSFMVPLVQLPISAGLFLGIKRLCDFPLEQLKVGGFGWITDLTVADPTYVLPLAMLAAVNVQLSVAIKDMPTNSVQTMHVFNLLRAASFITLPMMMYLPAGVVVYLFTITTSVVVQTLILRIPSVRKALDIPPTLAQTAIKPPTFMESVQFGAEWIQNKRAEAGAQARTQQRKKF